jgi:4-alpha-glucanotransferase
MQSPETATIEPAIRTNAWGIDLNFKDALGEWHETSAETVEALERAMGADAQDTPTADSRLLVVRKGEQKDLPGSGVIILEDGERISVRERLPADLPLGYHWLHLDDGAEPVRLIVGPAHCWLPENLRTWGWAVQLYAARSRESWGIGDFGDLEKLAAWSAELGAGMLLVNPLSAPLPLSTQEASPYSPSSRRFFNPIWLKIDWIPGATVADVPQLQSLGEEGRALNASRTIDRDKVFALKMRALELLWLRFDKDERFERFCQKQGAGLESYAIYCTLAETYGHGWHSWPMEHRHPANSKVAQFAAEHESRVRFHKWVQWLIDGQLERCAKHLGLMQDLPVGVNPDGADGWMWQDAMASGVGVGAPPDEFNTQGQNWGLAALAPHKLRAAGYEPFIQTVRAAMRHAGGLRVDHVMGLFRLFWIPQGMEGSKGAYVRYPYEEMLTILALESVRARAYVVGEDLGTVEDETRKQLSAHRIISYRLLWFEKDKPETYPKEALAAVTTHDLPTVAGLWSGRDFARQEELGLKPNEESTQEIHTRLKKMAGVGDGDDIADVICKTYELLAKAPARILTASLEDAAAVEERPNVPATTCETAPNWSLALPVPIEDLMQAELPKRIAWALRRDNSTGALI